MSVTVRSGDSVLGCLVLIVLVVIFVAYSDKNKVNPPPPPPKPAPITISWRQSKLDSAGLVLQVTNASDKHLSCRMDAVNKTVGESTKYVFDMAPNTLQEIGLLEANWTFRTGESVTIYVEGYDALQTSVP